MANIEMNDNFINLKNIKLQHAGGSIPCRAFSAMNQPKILFPSRRIEKMLM